MKLQALLSGMLRSRRGRLLILSYGRVGADQRSKGSAESHEAGSIDVAEFEWQMERIAERFSPVPLVRLMGHLGGKKPLAGAQVCVSLELGADQKPAAAEAALRRLSIPATWFVEFEHIGDGVRVEDQSNAQGPDWDLIRTLSAAGDEIGHSVRLSKAPPQQDSAQRRAHLSALRNRVEAHTGKRVFSLAVQGDGYSTTDVSLIHDAAIAGFSLGVNASAGINELRPISPMMLKRTAVTRNTTRAQFQSLLRELETGT
jgi:hypothetical protein